MTAVSVAPPPIPGAVEQWRHTLAHSYLYTVCYRPAEGPAYITVGTGPAGHPVEGVTDPDELDDMALLLTDRADWLRSQREIEPSTPRPADDDGQLTIYDVAEDDQ